MGLFYIETNEYDDVLVELNPDDTRDLFTEENDSTVNQPTGDQ